MAYTLSAISHIGAFIILNITIEGLAQNLKLTFHKLIKFKIKI